MLRHWRAIEQFGQKLNRGFQINTPPPLPPPPLCQKKSGEFLSSMLKGSNFQILLVHFV